MLILISVSTNIFVFAAYVFILVIEFIFTKILYVRFSTPWLITTLIYIMFIIYQILTRVNEQIEKGRVKEILYCIIDAVNGIPLVNRDDKIAFICENELAQTTLFKILIGEIDPDSGSIKWGQTITKSHFPKDNSEFFDGVNLNLVDWMRQYSEDQSESFLRGFLGRMLFSGDDALKPANVLSGGERVRCMLSRLMLSGSNVLILDQPTNHLDLEAITALNNGLISFKEIVLFSSHDHQFIQTTANRIIELTEDGMIDMAMTYDEYLERKEKRRKVN